MPTIPTGYKPSPLGPIPKDWRLIVLKNITTKIQNGFVGRATDHYVDDNKQGVLYIQGYNITEYGINFSGIKKVSEEFHKKNIKSKLQIGDLLTIQTGDVGLTRFVDKKIEGTNCHALIITRYIENVHSLFYHYFFNSPLGRYRLRRIETGSTMKHINCGDIKKLKLPLPPLPEQRAIASILSSCDETITTTQQLIEKLELRHKALCQQLLTGKKRVEGFDEKWEKLSISAYITYSPREVKKPEDNYLSLGVRSHAKGIFQKPDTDPNANAMNVLFEVKENDLVMSITFAWEHAVAIASKSDDGGLVSHRFPTYTFMQNKATHKFFKHYIKQQRFKYQLQVISPGGAGRNRVMSKKDFFKLPVIIPTLDEQEAIAKILDNSEKNIMTAKQKLLHMKHLKKGLMQ